MKRDFIDRVEPYLREKLALENFSVTCAEQIAGAGLSRSVVRIDASFAEDQTQSYILLLEDAASPVPPNRAAEFAALRSLSAYPALKVPQAYCMEETDTLLDCPFIVTQLLPGVTSPRQLKQPEYLAHGKRIARQSFEVLGALAALDADAVDLGQSVETPSPTDVHEAELDRLEKTLRDNHTVDLPVASAALRHLHRTVPPPPQKISIVHGDYRIGNYLFEPSGISGVIDWEMVHKGHPLEDLAWSLMPNWEFAAAPGLTAGYLTRPEVIETWEQASGLKVDPEALDWWLLFCHMKELGIYMTARHMFASGKTSEIMMALVGYAAPQKKESYIADMLKGKR